MERGVRNNRQYNEFDAMTTYSRGYFLVPTFTIKPETKTSVNAWDWCVVQLHNYLSMSDRDPQQAAVACSRMQRLSRMSASVLRNNSGADAFVGQGF